MFDAVLETWRTHDAINRFMLDHMPDAGLAAIPLLKNGQPGKGRDVARQFAHMVDVRVAHMRVAEKALMKGAPAIGPGASTSRRDLQVALEASGRGVEAVLTRLIENGESFRTRHPLVLLGYLISHESHHRGSIILALKQNGVAPSEELRFGIWAKWSGES